MPVDIDIHIHSALFDLLRPTLKRTVFDTTQDALEQLLLAREITLEPIDSIQEKLAKLSLLFRGGKDDGGFLFQYGKEGTVNASELQRIRQTRLWREKRFIEMKGKSGSITYDLHCGNVILVARVRFV
jgi:hypothetical protein